MDITSDSLGNRNPFSLGNQTFLHICMSQSYPDQYFFTKILLGVPKTIPNRTQMLFWTKQSQNSKFWQLEKSANFWCCFQAPR